MPRITVLARNKSGAMPWRFRPATEEEAAEWGTIELSRLEAQDLIKAGVWAPLDSPDAENNWVMYGEGGSVWAGNAEGPDAPVAKVRGKGGRRVGGRTKFMDESEKVRTMSVNMADATRQRLEEVAARRSEAEGRRVSVSSIVNELVIKYLEEQP